MKIVTLFGLFIVVNGSEHRHLSSYVCSFDFAQAGGDAWCDGSQENCNICNGEYVELTVLQQRTTCTPRWQGCTDHPDDGSEPDPCCGESLCIRYNQWWKGCEVPPSCCSWDQGNCGDDAWCNESSGNCQQCQGFWINPAALDGCLPMWNTCSTSAECCGSGECLVDNGWWHCNIRANVGPQPSPVLAPTSKPTAPPTVAPVPAPTSTPRALPTPKPSARPTPKPTAPPTSKPTTPPTPKPSAKPITAPTSKPITAPTRSPTVAPVPPSAQDCCSWDQGTCGEDVWCNQASGNCQQCQGFWINPSALDGCLPMWNTCSTSAECCGSGECLVDNGWWHCNIRANVGPQPSPVLAPTRAPTSPISNPTNPPQTPTNPTPTPPFGGLIGANNNSERITLPRAPNPRDTSQQENCPHNQGGLVDWTSLYASVSEGQDINLATNTKVVIRESVLTRLGVIVIPVSSQLILGENTNGITLDVEGIDVRGSLIIGSETCRIIEKVTITLHGRRPNDAVTNVRGPTFKGISVSGGTISLHGKRYYQTWTRLAATVQPGDTFLRLQEDVNWEPNQQIVLVSTAMKDAKDWHENEILRVQSVDNSPTVGSTVHLQSGVAHKHVGIQAYQAEVGLLTRTIVIQGAEDDSEPSDSQPKVCNGRNIFGNSDAPCPNTDLTGFGGHIIVHNGGTGQVEGVELFRMGQTNVLGRYPIHFHLLNDCPDCYFRESSVHRSYYRCVSIHGTNYMTVSENVAYDVAGYCYYLEDGVEQYNKLLYNLVALVHMIGPDLPFGNGQQTQTFLQSDKLTLPADVSASGFYITNIRNEIIGNAASGGWSGFAFPNLPTPLGPNRNVNMRPSSVLPLDGNKIDGNTAHSSGWWWHHAGAFYFGGSLYYVGDKLEYNPGRSFDFSNHLRNTCTVDLCARGNCAGWCDRKNQAFVRLTNSKAFLAANVGLNSWSGRMEISGFECHDCGLTMEALESGFWINNLLSQCRTGEPINLPPSARANLMGGNGFGWYDTDQEHIITESKFRNCGVQVDGRGCNGSVSTGCNTRSSVFSFLTHSSQFNPEIMQGTRSIALENCGRRFLMQDFRGEGFTSVSARLQNWLDEDGSVTGFGVRSVIASAVDNGMWWFPDSETIAVQEGPVNFFKLASGPERGLGHVRLSFDQQEHQKVDNGLVCTNGGFEPCPALGYIKHAGPMFANDAGLAVTAQPDIAGIVGGFAWLLRLNRGAPRELKIELIEVGPESPMMLQIAYPPGTQFNIFAFAPYCGNGGCRENFYQVGSANEVRRSLGNTYHMSSEGLLSVRIIQFSSSYIGGNQGWILPDYLDTYPWDSNSFLLDRFERSGVRLPRMDYGPYIQITATNCGSGVYCNQSPPNLNPNPCPSGFTQKAFDKCCAGSSCVCANGNAC